MRRLIASFAVFCFTLGMCSALQAQLNELSVKGKIIEIGPLLIAVQTDTGDKWLASLDPNRVEDNVKYTGLPDPKVEVSGTETAEVLKPGMYVRFEADVEKKKVIKSPVAELTVIGPGKENVYGLLPGGAGGAKEGDSERMLVVGQLSAASKAVITVSLPDGKSIKAKLTPDAVVKIASSDVQLIRAGDEVELKGYYGRAPGVFATVVNVKRVKAEKTTKKPATPAKKPDPKGGKNAKEAAEPAAFGEGDPSDPKPAVKPGVPAKKIIPGKILKVN